MQIHIYGALSAHTCSSERMHTDTDNINVDTHTGLSLPLPITNTHTYGQTIEVVGKEMERSAKQSDMW